MPPSAYYKRTLPPRRTILFSTSFILLFSILFLLNCPFTSNPLQSTFCTLANFTTSFSSLNTTPSTNTAQSEPVSAIAPQEITPLSSRLVENRLGMTSPPTLSSCDIFDGRWTFDDSAPPYPPGSCPYVDNSFNCFKSGRPDLGYLKYRWQPYGCDIPRFDGKRMMEILRGKRMVFVGDSLNRNMWESLVCSLSMFKASGRRVMKREGFYSYNYKDYNCSIVFITAPFLVQQWELPGLRNEEKRRETLKLDTIQEYASKHHDADFLIFNTGHWWNHNKVRNGENYFQEGNVVHKKMDVGIAYKKAIQTWAEWVDITVNKDKTKVLFMGYSATHFKGGQWNSGGGCDGETGPITDDKFLGPYPWLMKTLESVISKMRTPVIYLNITKLTEYRKDGHPSIYRRPGFKWRPGKAQDCSHWCLPGVPDSWNQLLYASLVRSSEESGATD